MFLPMDTNAGAMNLVGRLILRLRDFLWSFENQYIHPPLAQRSSKIPRACLVHKTGLLGFSAVSMEPLLHNAPQGNLFLRSSL